MNSVFLPLAHKLADKAGEIARLYFGTPLDIITKGDATPVTVADRSIEQTLREMIERARPDDGILGEEFGAKETRSGYTWVIDPIDGTKSFTVGRPTFGTLIGLCDSETPILGIIDQPILRERWIGIQGQPTTHNDIPVSCRKCPSLKDSIFGTGSPSQIGLERFTQIESAVRYAVLQGDCYFYGLMANGFIDIIAECSLGVYDYIALVPIIEGAGGIITDWNGKPKTLHGDDTVLAAGDTRLHRDMLPFLSR